MSLASPLMSVNPFANRAARRQVAAASATDPAPLGVLEMALDTLATVVRILGEFALEQEDFDTTAFMQTSEQWAQHVLMAAPPPGADAGTEGRRDWAGVREFVREYCRNSSTHNRTVITDLRQVVWVFIQNLNQTVSQTAAADERIRDHMGRLETLAQKAASTSELKREVLSTVFAVAQVMEERKKMDHARVEDLGATVRKLGQELESARKEGEVDPLTRLYNRKAFDAFLSRTVELAQAFDQPACLMLVDLDRFKPINDTFGHQTGDSVLSKLADVLSRIFLRKNDLVARYGGDELAVVLRETNVNDARTLADRLLRAVRAIRIEREGTSIGLTVSIGVAELRAGETAASWLGRSDKALYQAKHAGRDQVVAAP